MQLLMKSVMVQPMDHVYSPRTYPSPFPTLTSNYTLALVEIIQASPFLSLTVNYLPKVNNQICKDRIADSVSMQSKSLGIVYHLTFFVNQSNNRINANHGLTILIITSSSSSHVVYFYSLSSRVTV